MTDYEKNYIRMWKPLLERPDGTIDKDKMMRELSDYALVLEFVPRVYMAVTNGRISKPHTLPECVISEYDDCVQNDIEDAIEDYKRYSLCEKCSACRTCNRD